jgi:hypothetical protein
MNRAVRRTLLVAALLIAACIPKSASAQWVLLDADADALVRRGVDAMYNLRYNEADTIFSVLARDYPDHPAGYFLLALVDWWRIVPNIDVATKVKRYSESFNSRIDRVVDVCDARLEKNPADIVGLFFKGAALGYRARLTVYKNFNATALFDWISAALDGYEAYKIILECQRLAPSNSDVLLGSGLYNYMAVYIPEHYPSAKPYLGFLPPGDRQLGIQMLRISASRAQYAGTEAKYSLLEILTNMEKDYSGGLQVAQELFQRYPGNPVFHRFLAKNYYMLRDFQNADSTWTEILRRVKRRDSGYELTLARQGLYYLGDIRLQEGHYEDAVMLLKEAIEQSKRLNDAESSWGAWATLKLGYAYDMLKQRSDAIRAYNRVLELDDFNGTRDNARKYLALPYK